MSTKPRAPEELFRTLREQRLEDELEELLEMSDDELDRHIAENGGDPKAIRSAGVALVAELRASQERLGWHREMEGKLEEVRRAADTAKSKVKLPRKELLARIATARQNPRLATPLAVFFRKKSEEAATDDELQDILDEIELLGKLDED